VRGPDLSRFTKLSKCLKANAKNVTNLLILLSVLAEVTVKVYGIVIGIVKQACSRVGELADRAHGPVL